MFNWKTVGKLVLFHEIYRPSSKFILCCVGIEELLDFQSIHLGNLYIVERM